MLALRTVEMIQELLDEGKLPQRDIAKRMYVSRGTVNAIARGERGMWGRAGGDGDSTRFMMPPERCQACGYLVYKPCVICIAREAKAAKTAHRLLLTRKAA